MDSYGLAGGVCLIFVGGLHLLRTPITKVLDRRGGLSVTGVVSVWILTRPRMFWVPAALVLAAVNVRVLPGVKIVPKSPAWLSRVTAHFDPTPQGCTGRDIHRASNCETPGLA